MSFVTTSITWVEKETGLLKADVVAIEPSVLAWAKNFLVGITPVIKQAATNGVMAAITVPGTGAIKASAAFTAASAELVSQGVPVVENDLKAAIQIAYNALPSSLTSNVAAHAVVNAADSEVDTVGTKVEGEAAPAA